MQLVGDKLSELAITETKQDRVDAFGRSAFNRYYYAAFLITREMLKTLKSDWGTTPHRRIPDLLRGKVLAELRNETKRQLRSGILRPTQSSNMRTEANKAAADLSDLLMRAYDVRCLADYSPDLELSSAQGTFKLGNHTITAASNWSRDASIYTKRLLKLWKNLGLQ